jgi:uncharacterized protein (DUF488 family)
MQKSRRRMLTIGHSTLPIESFLGILEQNSVHVLIDIRTIPGSRHNPQFGQESLAASLQSAKIAYRWQKSLGGLRHARKDSINLGWRNGSFRGYADYMQTPEFDAAIDLLFEDTSPASSAGESQSFATIMCAEAVPWRCHRSLVADALTVRGVAVEDIFYDAKGKSHRKPHTLTPFARTEGTRVWYPVESDLFGEAAK